jgi:hypothetical protein
MEGRGRHRGSTQGNLENPNLLGGHCCFAGCTLTTCPRCHEQRCVRSMHVCAYVGRHRKPPEITLTITVPVPTEGAAAVIARTMKNWRD